MYICILYIYIYVYYTYIYICIIYVLYNYIYIILYMSSANGSTIRNSSFHQPRSVNLLQAAAWYVPVKFTLHGTPLQQLKCLDKQIVFHTWKLGNAVFLGGSTSDFSRGNGIVAVFQSYAEACSPKSLTQTNNYKKTIGLLLSGKHTVDGCEILHHQKDG